MANTTEKTFSTGYQIELVKEFDAPIGQVFDMWADPLKLAKWWGPKGFTAPVCQSDFKEGGAIYIEMCDPAGNLYPMSGEYREIVAPTRLSFVSSALDDNKKPLFETLATAVFSEKNGKTTINLTSLVTSAGENAAMYLQGMKEGWDQTLECLREAL